VNPRVLLADDSAHAQRMGERILRDEGFDVVAALDAATARARLQDSDPDVLLVDVYLPGLSGYDLCRQVKSDAQHRHRPVILIAGLLEPLDETAAALAGADGTLKKPFEASVMIQLLRPLVDQARHARGLFATAPAPPPADALPAAAAPPPVDAERVRAAITLALDRALPNIIDEITEKVLLALGH
jgi:CheY-like chemotaxis protein